MRVHPESLPGVLAETTRRYPRTLAQAFPVSEGNATGIELVAERDTLARIWSAVEWLAGCLLLLWLAWACLHGVEPLRP